VGIQSKGGVRPAPTSPEPIQRRFAHQMVEARVKYLRRFVIASLLVSVAAPAAHAQSIRASVEALRSAPAPALTSGQTGVTVGGPFAKASGQKPNRALVVTLGVVGGLFGGAYIGAKIEGSGCQCDDPGLKGAMIGAPVGAIAGGVLAWILTK